MTETRKAVDVGRIDCPICGRPSQRVIVYPNNLPGITGFAQRPTKEAPINLTRFTEAHGEVLRQAEKAGVEPPDLLGAAKKRVARGDVKAIE